MDKILDLFKYVFNDFEEGLDLVFGTIGQTIDGYFIEYFLKIETANDLPDPHTVSLRHRLNPSRNYKTFYFKTSVFDKLKNLSKTDNKSLADFIVSNNTVKFIDL